MRAAGLLLSAVQEINQRRLAPAPSSNGAVVQRAAADAGRVLLKAKGRPEDIGYLF